MFQGKFEEARFKPSGFVGPSYQLENKEKKRLRQFSAQREDIFRMLVTWSPEKYKL